MGSSPRIIRHNRDTRASPRVFCPAIHGLAYSFVLGVHLTPSRVHFVSYDENNPSSLSAAKELCARRQQELILLLIPIQRRIPLQRRMQIKSVTLLYLWCRRRNPFKGRCQRSPSASPIVCQICRDTHCLRLNMTLANELSRSICGTLFMCEDDSTSRLSMYD